MDAKHHLSVGRCEPRDQIGEMTGYRKRRDAEDEAAFQEIVAQLEIEGKSTYGAMASPQQLDKLEGKVENFKEKKFRYFNSSNSLSVSIYENSYALS